MTCWGPVHQLHNFNEVFRDFVVAQSHDDCVSGRSVECLFEVKKGQVQGLLLFSELFDQLSCGKDGVCCGFPFDEPALLGGDLDACSNTFIHDTF